MDRLFHDLHPYCEAHSTPPSALLHALERETHLKTLAPQMMSGHLQGQFLQLLSNLMRPRRILEIGTFTGYATLCLAAGLAPEGELHTIEANPEVVYLARKYFALAGYTERIQLHVGKAETIIPQLPGTFDLVLIDAGKRDYADHYDLVIDRVVPGGLLLADNVLWSGKVLDENPDTDTQILQAFNQKIQADPRVDNLLLPLRDGLMLMRKREEG